MTSENHDSTDTIIQAVREMKAANAAFNREMRNGRASYSVQARFHDCMGRVLALRLPPEEARND